jgi:ribonuclease-3
LSYAIKNIFGFYPGNISLYKLAFRHKSASAELKNGFKINNERLEFLGDAILSAVVADFLFKKFPFKDEGFLTELRSKIVSRSQLNKLSEKLGLNKLIQTTDSSSFNRSILGDAFEALIGAIYIDKGYQFTSKIILGRIIKYHLNIDEIESTEVNFKSKLIEFAQKEKKTVEFVVVDEVGYGYQKYYVINALLDKIVLGQGKDTAIKKAEQNASEDALNKLFS